MNEERLNDYIDRLSDSYNQSAIPTILDELPDPSDYDFELYIERIVEQDTLTPDELEDILTADNLPVSLDRDKVRFGAFLGISISYLRQSNLSDLERHLDDYQNEYATHPIYSYIRSRYLKKRGSPTAVRESIELSKSAKEQLPDHAGVLHSYAHSLAMAVENEFIEFDEDEIMAAKEHLQKAIERYPQRAEFYSTKGRLIAINREDFDQARELIREAMNREDSTRPDYPLLMGEYQFHLSRIDSLQYKSKLNDELSDAIERIEDTETETRQRIEAYQTRTLQSLGFFAGILAVIVSSAEIFASVDPQYLTELILFLNGGLLIVFTAFTALLPQEELPWRRIIAAAILGFLLIGLGIWASLSL